MGFYFTVHTILGLLAGASGWTLSLSKRNAGAVPRWVHGPYASFSGGVAAISAISAVITTFVNWGFVWGLATIGELVLGAVIAGILPLGFRFLALGIALPTSVAIMGALWGFWYI